MIVGGSLLTFLDLVQRPGSEGGREDQTQVACLREQLVHLQPRALVCRQRSLGTLCVTTYVMSRSHLVAMPTASSVPRKPPPTTNTDCFFSSSWSSDRKSGIYTHTTSSTHCHSPSEHPTQTPPPLTCLYTDTCFLTVSGALSNNGRVFG